MEIRRLLAFRQHSKLVSRISSSFYSVDSGQTANNSEAILSKQLQTKIKLTGPITIAEYMKDVLTNPLSGYYMHRDMFGQSGDFVTSPELSQTFGELIAIWFLNEWSKAGSPKPIKLVELGPGRGSLCQDLLRVFHQFRLHEHASVHLVEVSPHLSNLQARQLCTDGSAEPICDNPVNGTYYKSGRTASGVPVYWYRRFDDVPYDDKINRDAFTFLVANEFFDALPIHKFHKTDRGYREVLIDCDGLGGFRFVLSKHESLVGRMFIKNSESREHVEVSPEGLALAQKIGSRIETYGGLALIADYGHDGTTNGDTFRAYKSHKQHDPLVDPGSADLTADVDFSALKLAATNNLSILGFGPITQKQFLVNMGLEYRINVLRKNATESQLKGLEYGYKMLVDPENMGSRFKFLALVPSALQTILERHPITGF